MSRVRVEPGMVLRIPRDAWPGWLAYIYAARLEGPEAVEYAPVPHFDAVVVSPAARQGWWRVQVFSARYDGAPESDADTFYDLRAAQCRRWRNRSYGFVTTQSAYTRRIRREHAEGYAAWLRAHGRPQAARRWLERSGLSDSDSASDASDADCV